jgi:hypothetical protein
LLDTLERELVAAPADEVRDAWHESGRARNIALQEVRALLNEAIAASEEGSAEPLPPGSTGLDQLGETPHRAGCLRRRSGSAASHDLASVSQSLRSVSVNGRRAAVVSQFEFL